MPCICIPACRQEDKDGTPLLPLPPSHLTLPSLSLSLSSPALLSLNRTWAGKTRTKHQLVSFPSHPTCPTLLLFTFLLSLSAFDLYLSCAHCSPPGLHTHLHLHTHDSLLLLLLLLRPFSPSCSQHLNFPSFTAKEFEKLGQNIPIGCCCSFIFTTAYMAVHGWLFYHSRHGQTRQFDKFMGLLLLCVCFSDDRHGRHEDNMCVVYLLC